MSEIAIKLNCPHCLGTKVVKNGREKDKTQNFLCRDCGKQFQSHYKYAGANPTIKPLNPYAIKEFRDTRLQIVLGVSRYTVLRTLLVVAEKTLIEPKREHHHSFNR